MHHGHINEEIALDAVDVQVRANPCIVYISGLGYDREAGVRAQI